MKRLILAISALLLASTTFSADAARAKVGGNADEFSQAYDFLMENAAEAVVPVKFVMRFSAGGKEQRHEDKTQGVIVSSDGLLLVPERAVSIDLGALAGEGSQVGQLIANSGNFRVRLPGSDQWQPADLVTRDSELGLAWLRLRDVKETLKFIDLNNSAVAKPGTTIYSPQRTSDEWGAVSIIRPGNILGKTSTPRSLFLVDGVPGIALNEKGQVYGYVDANIAALARAAGGGFGLDMSDMVFHMVEAKRIAAVTMQAAKLPVVAPSEDEIAEGEDTAVEQAEAEDEGEE